MQTYKELLVYQKSYEQAKEAYKMAGKFPDEEKFGLTSQIKRAATSIPLNIAEGYGKVERGKEVVRFLSMARGSSAELEVLLDFAKDFGYITEIEHEMAVMRCEEVGKMLTGLIKSLSKNYQTDN